MKTIILQLLVFLFILSIFQFIYFISGFDQTVIYFIAMIFSIITMKNESISIKFISYFENKGKINENEKDII